MSLVRNEEISPFLNSLQYVCGGKDSPGIV